jgi:hypothetical protein
MPPKKRLDKAKARRRFEEAYDHAVDAGKLTRSWEPHEVSAANEELGANFPHEYLFGGLSFGEVGEAIAPTSWTNPKPDYRAGGERMAEKAQDNRRYIKALAGDLWGHTDRIQEIQHRVRQDLAKGKREIDSIPVSRSTLRRYFKLCP